MIIVTTEMVNVGGGHALLNLTLREEDMLNLTWGDVRRTCTAKPHFKGVTYCYFPGKMLVLVVACQLLDSNSPLLSRDFRYIHN